MGKTLTWILLKWGICWLWYFPRFKCSHVPTSRLPSVLTLVEATASWTLSMMNSLVILREGSSLKRELMSATLAASRLASALLKQHLRRKKRQLLEKSASYHSNTAAADLCALLRIHLHGLSLCLNVLLGKIIVGLKLKLINWYEKSTKNGYDTWYIIMVHERMSVTFTIMMVLRIYMLVKGYYCQYILFLTLPAFVPHLSSSNSSLISLRIALYTLLIYSLCRNQNHLVFQS